MPVSLQVHVRSVTVARRPLLGLAHAVLSLVGQSAADMTLSLVGDRRMRQLNRRFRRKDCSTDVLAFAFREARAPHGFNQAAAYLGDVVIAMPTARRQARAAGRPLEDELVTLLIHGVLHLCGYDHERSRPEASRMQKKERQMRRRLGPIAPLFRPSHHRPMRTTNEG